MFEKVNPSHPDKVADRIAGAMVDLAYKREKDPKIAVEVLIGHGNCLIIAESSVKFKQDDIQPIVDRIAGKGIKVKLVCKDQDKILAENQEDEIRCGDNGIFKGCKTSVEQQMLTEIARNIYKNVGTDGKYIIDENKITICQSNAERDDIVRNLGKYALAFNEINVNPLGYWTGGLDVDTGATNRKLGSDMGDAVTGGGLHGKDLSKADVSVNIYCHLMAQRIGMNVSMSCSIGDEEIYEVPFAEMVQTAKEYIDGLGGFEKLAEWGLIR